MYSVNTEKVFYDTSEGESIVVNFTTGNYYCFNETGAAVFAYLTEGGDPGKISCGNAEGLAAFLKTLEEKELLKKDEEPYREIGFAYSATSETPSVTEYDEVKNLILADPVQTVMAEK